jgi:hypothetical protein
MRFQERDGEILHAIYEYGGVLAGRQIKEMFWPDKSLRAVQKRLSKLHNHHYIARPTNHDWKTKPIPESVYWLDWNGAMWLAEQRGIELSDFYHE